MPASSLELHPEALEDAVSAYAWYFNHSARAADIFVTELERAVDLAVAAPQRWPSYVHGTRRYLLKRYPYSLVYKVYGTEVVVFAVAHARRKPGYWKQRVVTASWSMR